MSKLKITLIRSTIGCLENQKRTVEALGLNKIGVAKVFEDTPSLRGMLDKVGHLVKTEEAAE
jgi:large subunit ribosomal protein L30